MKDKHLDFPVLDDYREFAEGGPSESRVPAGLSDLVLNRVRSQLHPSPWAVFAKLSMIHFFVAVGTLSICPQFGVSILGEGLGLMRHFAAFGTYGCVGACGGFFIGSSIAIAALVLRAEELRVLRQKRLLQLAALGSLSLGTFIMMDADILIAFAAAWLGGSLLAGAAIVEISWAIRRPKLAQGLN